MSGKNRIICWQGWRIELPRRWDPVKLEGDHAEGHALFADALRPRLGFRWQTLKNANESEKAVKKLIRAEVGQLAALEAKDYQVELSEPPGSTWRFPLLYSDPDPPGRDILCAYSETSHRLVQIAYHAHRREKLFAHNILPTLADCPLDRAAMWSIFDLSCVIPAGMRLKSQRLNAGDLGLTFADRSNEVTIRQIAVAQLALERQSLDGWIVDQQKTSQRFHQRTGQFVDTCLFANGKNLPARISRMHLRTRYVWMWNQTATYTTITAHLPGQDRLLILHGSDESLLRMIAESVVSPTGAL